MKSTPITLTTPTCVFFFTHPGGIGAVEQPIAEVVLDAHEWKHGVAAEPMDGEPRVIGVAVLDRMDSPTSIRRIGRGGHLLRQTTRAEREQQRERKSGSGSRMFHDSLHGLE
ncbi:MAG TPA: hypothetical protein VK636_02315 [Gemmatimonadaceae bacterium]|nr:hypothetical protein [Gemmatimonadaceae bacterium]